MKILSIVLVSLFFIVSSYAFLLPTELLDLLDNGPNVLRLKEELVSFPRENKNGGMKLDNDDSGVVRIDVPGYGPEDISINWIEDGLMLEIKGDHKCMKDEKFCVERSFERKFTVNSGLDGSRTEADLKNGILTLNIPPKPVKEKITIPIGLNNNKVKEQQAEPQLVDQTA